jgi:hypothetical protein
MRLLQVSTKATMRDSKPRHMKGVPDKDEFAIKGYNSTPTALHGDLSIVAHPDPQTRDQLV